jgi:predicted metalloprotease with PDZ domain
MTVRDETGALRGVSRLESSKWRINTAGARRVSIAFDYAARSAPGWNRAAIADRFAFFTGTELFLEAQGRRAMPATVCFVAPSGRRIASAPQETDDPALFRAVDYDALVDSPTVLGSFDVMRFELDGKPHDFVTIPAGSYDRENVHWFVGRAADVMRTQRPIFGSLPYDKYLFFWFSPVTEYTGGNLEHANSSVYSGSSVLADTDLGSVAHEFSHLWNVKRIRPAEMRPYDYSHVPAVPTLWVSEGITTYYERLTLYRAGISQVSVPADGAGADGARLRPAFNPVTAFLVGRNDSTPWEVTPSQVNALLAAWSIDWIAGPTADVVADALRDRSCLVVRPEAH